MLTILFFLFFKVSFLHADIAKLHEQSYVLSSSGSFKSGQYGLYNPSLLMYQDGFNAGLSWTDSEYKPKNTDFMGLFLAYQTYSLAVLSHRDFSLGNLTTYRFSKGFGTRMHALGAGYSFSNGSLAYNRKPSFILGYTYRPNRFISSGISSEIELGGDDQVVIFDGAYRPYGNEKITFFMDYAANKRPSINGANLSLGVMTEFLPGIRIAGRYLNNQAFSLGVDIGLGFLGFGSYLYKGKDPDTSYAMHHVQIGGYDRNIFRNYLSKDRYYFHLDLSKPIQYQPAVFQDTALRFWDILSQIDEAEKDDAISGMVINLSRFSLPMSQVWELRRQIQKFKSTGKRVIAFISDTSSQGYYLASVADKIMMDPMGDLSLQGFYSGNIFFKGTLSKLGVGYEEFRLYKFKSVMESFSREAMSEADKFQRQAYLDSTYQVFSTEIGISRKISTANLNQVIKNDFYFTADTAKEKKLIDGVYRIQSVDEVIEDIEGVKKEVIGNSKWPTELPRDGKWGSCPKILILYALGRTELTTGMKIERLVQHLQTAIDDNSISGIVVRVDSPGGSGLASDIFYDALKKGASKKPIVISQGQVAASGGYWVSLGGSKILSTPYTYTGSIGVIFGHFYDAGLYEKLGVTTDEVKTHPHADLGFGLLLPKRNFNAEEKEKVKSIISSYYKKFVQKVSMARNKKPSDIEPLAQGRFYSGLQAKNLDLVDEMGGLWDALELTKELAGYSASESFEVVEFPKAKFFNLQNFLTEDADIFSKTGFYDFKYRYDNQSKPMVILPFEDETGIFYLKE